MKMYLRFKKMYNLLFHNFRCNSEVKLRFFLSLPMQCNIFNFFGAFVTHAATTASMTVFTTSSYTKATTWNFTPKPYHTWRSSPNKQKKIFNFYLWFGVFKRKCYTQHNHRIQRWLSVNPDIIFHRFEEISAIALVWMERFYFISHLYTNLAVLVR